MKKIQLIPILFVAMLFASCRESFIGTEGPNPPEKVTVYDLFYTSYDSNGIGTISCFSTGDTVTKTLYHNGIIYSPPTSGIIVFVQPDNFGANNHTIMAMNTDGSNPHVVSMVHDLEYAVLSPDGKQILYAVHRGFGTGDIYTMGTDGSNPIKIMTSARDDARPAFSNDGKQIAAIKFYSPSQKDELTVTPLDGSSPRVLLSGDLGGGKQFTRSIVWSSDNSTIYLSAHNKDHHLYKIDAASGAKTNIDCSGDLGGGVALAPNDGFLVYTDDDGDLYSMELSSYQDSRFTFTDKILEQNPDIDSSANKVAFSAQSFGPPGQGILELRIYDRSSGITSKVANGVLLAFWKR
jgi:Tol biopolymer transport system component